MSDPSISAAELPARRDLVNELSNLRELAGRPGIARIAEEMGAAGMPASRSRLYDYLLGKALPTLAFVEAFARACERIGHLPHTPDRIESLRKTWTAASREAAGQPPEPRADTEQGVQTSMIQQGRGYAYVVDGEVVLGHSEASIGAEAESTIDDTRQYLSGLEVEIRDVAKSARRRLNTYQVLRFLVLSASAVTPLLALLKADPWVTASVGALAFLSEGVIQLTRIHDRAILDSRRVFRLSREFRMFRTRVDAYAEPNGFTLLVKRVEEIRERNDNEYLRIIRQTSGGHDSLSDENDSQSVDTD